MPPSVDPPPSRWKVIASRVASSLTGGASPSRARIKLPEGLRTIYAIGDVHGHLDHFLRLERVIAADAALREGPSLMICLGDYVDRGPRSPDTLAHLAKPPAEVPRLCLCGNHEAMMLSFLTVPRDDHPWLRMGGSETLSSYGLDIRHVFSTYQQRPDRIPDLMAEAIPEDHVAFLRDLPILAWDDHIVFVHAGVRPGVRLDRQKDNDLLWIREPFLSEGAGWLDKIVVHGHTLTKTIQLQHGRIGIDKGVQRSGELTALRLGDDGIFTLSSET